MINKCTIITSFIVVVALIVAMPILVVALSWFAPINELWLHFQNTILFKLFSNTIILIVGVSIGVAILGTTLAWLITMTEFYGRKYLEWALLLPFAVPAYVLALIYLGIFDYAGPLQTWLRETFFIDGFDIRSSHITIIVTFILAFYPYVYIVSRAALKRQQANIIISARLLGAGAWRVFWRISVPMIRPAIAAGVLVTIMETLADFGVVSLFNYNTFTTAIYSAWSDFRSIALAAQLASILVLIAFILIYFERLSRGRTKYYSIEIAKHRPYKLKGYKSFIASSFVIIVLLLSFVIPIMQLVLWAWQSFGYIDYEKHISLFINTLTLSITATVIIVIIASVLAFPNSCLNKNSGFLSNMFKFSVSLATLGYAIPGSVMVVGLLYGVYYLSYGSEYLFGVAFTRYLFGSVILLLLAYSSRFMAIAYNTIHAAAQQIKPSITQSAQLLGASKLRIALTIELPMMTPGILAGCLLVAIDVAKELPATYLLRPLGWDTLAISIYELSTEGLNEEAAIPALLIVFMTSMLILVLQKIDSKVRYQN